MIVPKQQNMHRTENHMVENLKQAVALVKGITVVNLGNAKVSE